MQELSLSSWSFAALTAPSSASGSVGFDLLVQGLTVGHLAPGETFQFAAHGLTGIPDVVIQAQPGAGSASPAAGAQDPGLGLFLNFQGAPEALSVSAEAFAVPEPASWTLWLTGVLAQVARRGLRQRHQGQRVGCEVGLAKFNSIPPD